MKTLYFQMVIIMMTACVSQQDESEPFIEFEEAYELECHPWQKDEQTLGIYEVVQSHKTPAAFIAKVRRRNNEVQFHYRQLVNGEIKVERTMALNLPQDARLLGHVGLTGNNHFAVINPQNGYRLEIRSQPDNRIVYQDRTDRSPSLNEKIYLNGTDGFWLLFHTEKDELEVSNLQYYKLSEDKKNFHVTAIKGYQSEPEKDIQVVLDGQLFTFYPMENETRAWVEYQMIDHSGKIGKRIDLQIPISRKVDKWSAMIEGETIYMAIVDGESFLREANLKVARIDYGNGVLRPQWLKSRSLMNFHVSTPIWLRNRSETSVLVPKWLDGKSTIARYLVGQEDIVGAGHVGQFPKAARITYAFSDSEDLAQFMIVRTQDQIGWNFSMCRMEPNK